MGALVALTSTVAVGCGTTEEAPFAGRPERVSAVVSVEHEALDDLTMRVGVLDRNGDVTCAVEVEVVRRENVVDLSKCARLYPPSNENQWFADVRDHTRDDKRGVLKSFAVEGPDGTHTGKRDVPINDLEFALSTTR